jgi:hypothetical protein
LTDCGIPHLPTTRRLFNTLPSSLMAMYEYNLQSVAFKNQKAAQRLMRVFEIMSCASRPLTVNEAAEVFAVEFRDNNMQVLEEDRLQNPGPDLLQKCEFIRIENEHVRFADSSVLDYLSRHRDTAPVSDFRIDEANSAITLSKLCLYSVLNMIQRGRDTYARGPFRSSPGSFEPAPSSDDIKEPFDDYAYEFWLEETARLKPVKEIESLLDSILLQIKRIPAKFTTPHFSR